MQGIGKHIGIVKECVLALERLVAAVAASDPSATGLRDQVFALEAKAADMRRELDSGIAEGAFFGGVREDILNLIGEIGRVANAAKDSARLLTLCALSDQSALTILKDEHMASFFADLKAALDSLGSVIESLETSKAGVVSGAKEIEDYEEAADTEKAALLEALFKSHHGLDPVDVIQLRDFIFAADDIADNSVNASDVLVVLVAKGYG
jgi:predicted phosphate transport protein (TIGR00153 family)